MLTERMIINGLIITASFILVPFIASESLTADYLPALILIGGLALIMSFFILKEKLSVCPVLGAFFGGSFTFLPIPLGLGQIASMLLILYFVTGYVIIRQRPVKLGRSEFFGPMAIVLGIIFYHVHSLSFGALGGSTEGARPAYLIYVAALAYFCGINLPSPTVTFLGRMPWYAVVVTFISSFPYLLTTYVPSLAPYFYSVTSSVNVEAYTNTAGGTQEAAGPISSKLAAFGPMGGALQGYLLAHYPIGTWFSPSRLWVVCLSFICTILAISCGYRSDLFSFVFIFIATSWCYYSWRALLIPTVLAVGMLVFISASSNNLISIPVNKLPMIAQRTMSFLPGDWDEEAIESGKSSNEFRASISRVYLSEYALNSPFLGNGFEIDKGEFESAEGDLGSGRGDLDYLQAKVFIIGKMFHTGWISVYDNVGIFGFLGFIAMQLSVISVSARFVFGPRADRRSSLYPLYAWLFSYVLVSNVSFYTVFGNFADAFAGLLSISVVFSHLLDLQKTTEPPQVPGLMPYPSDFSGLQGTEYGNRYAK